MQLKQKQESSNGRPLRPLRRAELPVDAVQLARFLIGKYVVHETPAGRLSARIVETEAYIPGDPACHAFRGRTPRNGSLFLKHGHAYVYIAYGSAMMLNVSAEEEGTGAGVLIRAGEPCEGIERMEKLRGTIRLKDLARGPGRLAQAMGIDKTKDALDLCADGSHAGPLFLARSLTPEKKIRIGRSVRIGLTKGAEHVLRFYERGNEFVSGPQRLRE